MAQQGMIKAEDVAAFVRARPFVPFRIHMTDGATFEVRHPECAMVAPRIVTVGVPSERRVGMMQAVEWCSVLQIVRLEPLAAAS